MPILIAILLGLSALLIVAYPLLGLDTTAATSAAGDDALTDVAERERSAKMALRDVDFDYRLGNLEENDYDALRSRYERRALAALRTRYEREQALDHMIDEQLAAMQDKKSGKNGNHTRRESLVGAQPAAPADGADANIGKNGNRSNSPLPAGRGAGGEVPIPGKNGNRSGSPRGPSVGASGRMPSSGGNQPTRSRRRKGM